MRRHGVTGWLKVTLLALLAVLALLTAGVAYLLANPAALVPVAEQLTERFVGRTLAIDGDVALDVSLKPRVTARDVRFGNATWSSNADMVTAGYVLVQIDLADLLDNRVHLLDLDVREATVHLEDPTDGVPNWVLFEEEDDADAAAWSFLIQGLELTDVEVHASIGELAPVHLEVTSLTETSSASGHLQLAGSGRVNGDAWRLDGSVGPLAELLAAGRVELDLDGTIDDVDIQASGSIGELRTLAGVDLALEVLGPDAELLGEIFNMPEAFADEVALSASIRPDPRGHQVNVDGHIAQFATTAHGTVADLVALDGWDLALEVTGPDAGVFGRALQIRGFPDGPFRVAGTLHLHGTDIDLTDTEITTEDASLTVNADFADFPRLAGSVGSVHLMGPDSSEFRELLGLPGLPAESFELELTLAPDHERLTARLGSTNVTADGTAGAYPDFDGTRLEVAIDGADIGLLTRIAKLDLALSGAYSGSGTLKIEQRALELLDARFEHGPARFDGRFALPTLDELGAFTVSGTVNVSDLAEAGRILGVSDLPAEPVVLEAELVARAGRFELTHAEGRIRNLRASGSGRLGDLTGLEGLDVRLAVEGPDIEELLEDAIGRFDVTIPFTLSSRLRGRTEGVELIDFALEGPGGRIEAEGLIASAPELVGSRLSISGAGDNLAELLPPLPRYVPNPVPWRIEAKLRLPSARHLEVAESLLQSDKAEVSVAGTLDLADQSRTDLRVQAHGDSLSDLGQIGESTLPDMPFSLDAELDGSPNHLNVTRLEAGWGASDLQASGTIELNGKPRVTLHGRSELMDLVDLQQAIFGELEAQEAAKATRVFPVTPIPMDDLQLLDAELDIAVQRFRGRRASLDDVAVTLQIQDGGLRLDRAAFTDALGSFDAEAVLTPDGDTAEVQLNITGRNADFGFLVARDQPPETIPRYDLDVTVTGRGRTIAEVAGSLTGEVLVASPEGGRIDNALLDAFTGDFLTNVLDVLNPFVSSEGFTTMDCLVVNASIDDGKVNLEPGFVMRTDRVNMFVFGKANLKTERLDLSLATQARRGIGISAATITNPYFKIGGTFMEPALQLDATSAAVAYSVATATAGLSILIRGFWDRLMGGQNPCPRFIEYKRDKAKDKSADEDQYAEEDTDRK